MGGHREGEPPLASSSQFRQARPNSATGTKNNIRICGHIIKRDHAHLDRLRIGHKAIIRTLP